MTPFLHSSSISAQFTKIPPIPRLTDDIFNGEHGSKNIELIKKKLDKNKLQWSSPDELI